MGKYNIERLGWFNFETLIGTLLKKVIGAGVSTFSGSSDQGRDATYLGKANFPSIADALSGHWIFQVKFRSVLEGNLGNIRSELKTTLVNEINGKIKKHDHCCDIYVYITNCPLTAQNKDEMNRIIEQAGIEKGFVLGESDIEQFLDINPTILRAFPQMMGLSQLREITHWGLNQRSLQYLNSIQEDIETFVVTQPYLKALELLNKQHFCILTGAPKMGKTCTADALAVAFVADGFTVFDLRTQKDFFEAYDREEKQLFLCDDVFGDIALQEEKKDEWTQSINRLLGTLDKDHKLIWTARSYILKEAIDDSKLEEERQIIKEDVIKVNVEELSELEKAMILYNHAKKANLSEDIKEIIKDDCNEIIKSPYYAPETIRQLCTGVILEFSKKYKDPKEVSSQIKSFMRSPGLAWKKAFKKVPQEVNFLCIQLMSLGGMTSYNILKDTYENEVNSKGYKWLNFTEALNRGEGSFLKRKSLPEAAYIQFYHPSMRDLLVELIKDDTLIRKSYIDKLSIREYASVITTIDSNADESSSHRLKINSSEDVALLNKHFDEKILPNLSISTVNLLFSYINIFLNKNSYEIMPSAGQYTVEKMIEIIPTRLFWIENRKSKDSNLSSWNDLFGFLSIIIKKTPFGSIPVYIKEILEAFKDLNSVTFWEIAKKCHNFSEILTLKMVSYEDRKVLHDFLEEKVVEGIDECPNYEEADGNIDWSAFDACEKWHDEYNEVFEDCKKYLEIFSEDEIKLFSELEYHMDHCPQSVPGPDDERDYDYYDRDDSIKISDIFKDL